MAGGTKYENQFTLSVFENRLKDILSIIIQRDNE